MHCGAHENKRFDNLRWNPCPSPCLCGIANVYSHHYRIIRQGIVGQFWLWVLLISYGFSIGLRLRYTQKRQISESFVCQILHILAPTYWAEGFPSGSAGKESTCNAGDKGDAGSIPGSGWSPEGENGNPLPYSCLENPMDRGVKGHEESNKTEGRSMHALDPSKAVTLSLHCWHMGILAIHPLCMYPRFCLHFPLCSEPSSF